MSTYFRTGQSRRSRKTLAEFRHRYVEELENSPAVHAFVRKITGRPVVTLLFASKNAAENHTLIW